MRIPCIKIVSLSMIGSSCRLESFAIGPFSQIYRNAYGTIRTIKSSLVFTEPDDAARFIRTYCPNLVAKQVWIASAKTIEPRDWIFSNEFMRKTRDLPQQMREHIYQCGSKKERPENINDLIKAISQVEMFLMDAPRGTAIATNLRLEKVIMTSQDDMLLMNGAKEISKALDEFNEEQAQMTERGTI